MPGQKQVEVITEEMFADWLDHPVTAVLQRRLLPHKRAERKNAWESGEILSLAKDEQMLRNAAALGECQGFRYVQELNYETMKGDLEDANEHEWA